MNGAIIHSVVQVTRSVVFARAVDTTRITKTPVLVLLVRDKVEDLVTIAKARKRNTPMEFQCLPSLTRAPLSLSQHLVPCQTSVLRSEETSLINNFTS